MAGSNTVVQLKLLAAGDGRKILSPFDKRECPSLKHAADIAAKSESTLRGWCEEHGLAV